MTEERAPYRTDRLENYHGVAKQLLSIADRTTVEELARVLAVHVGYYQRCYGQIPLEQTLATLNADSPDDQQLQDLEEGMKVLVSVLALATGVADQSNERNRQRPNHSAASRRLS